MESVADNLMKVIFSVTREEVILVGYSMGARIALYMALKYHEKVYPLHRSLFYPYV